jgi:hypothetical protein
MHSDIYSYKDDIRITEEFLDTLDLTNYIANFYEVDELMGVLEDHYSKMATDSNPDFFQGFLFNAYGTDEFCQYIEKKYGVKTKEECIVKHYIVDKPKKI